MGSIDEVVGLPYLPGGSPDSGTVSNSDGKRRYHRPANSLPEGRSRADYDALIREGLPLVEKLASSFVRRLPSHSDCDRDDLMAEGAMALLKLAESYDPARGTFQSYVDKRVRGAMQDHLRVMDYLTRGDRRRVRELERFERQRNSAPILEEELEATGFTLERHRRARYLRGITHVSLNHPSDPKRRDGFIDIESLGATSEEDYYRCQQREQLYHLVGELPDQLRIVVSLYIYNGLKFHEIGTVLDVSESRISQLYRKATEKLQKMVERENF